MRPFLFFLLLCGSRHAAAQPASQISIGTVDTVYSEILQQQRPVLIYLPPDYSPQKKYPVCYLLDGETHFYFFTGIARHLAGYAVPEMIVVGIVNRNRNADYTPTHDASFPDSANGRGDRFEAFLERELIPYIERRYATAPYRILAGHSLGGLFVVNTMLHHPGIFRACIALDPALWWDGMKLVDDAPELLSDPSRPETSLYLGFSSVFPVQTVKAYIENRHTAERPADVRAVLRFERELEHRSTASWLRWRIQRHPNEIHGSLPLPGYYDGLRSVFDFYRRPAMNVLTDTTAEMLAHHYEEVSRHMRYTILPPEADLAGIAWRSAVLEHNPDRAYRYLQTYLRLYPTSAGAHESMADYYAAKGDTAQAGIYYRQAEALSNPPK